MSAFGAHKAIFKAFGKQMNTALFFCANCSVNSIRLMVAGDLLPFFIKSTPSLNESLS
jgi:hypothetical protein